MCDTPRHRDDKCATRDKIEKRWGRKTENERVKEDREGRADIVLETDCENGVRT